jgi:hypothetical protein
MSMSLETTGDTDSAVSKKPVREPKLTKNEYEGASDLEDRVTSSGF